MGTDSWNQLKFLHHKVRHMVRRGYLKKTYYDEKIMQARINTGVQNENDRIAVMHPVGYMGRVKPGDKVEVLTLDVSADPSRRVVLAIIGDRETHPKVSEGESIIYSPGDKKKFVRIYKKPSGQGGAPEEKESKEGIHQDADDLKITSTTKDTYSNKADKGIGHETSANFTVKASNNTQMEAQKHIRVGEMHHDRDTFTKGVEHAADHVAGGSTSISETATLADDANREDGSKNWSATGIPGKVSLLATAASLGSLQGIVQQLAQSQSQANSNTQQQIDALWAAINSLMGVMPHLRELGVRLDDLERRVAAVERR